MQLFLKEGRRLFLVWKFAKSLLPYWKVTSLTVELWWLSHQVPYWSVYPVISGLCMYTQKPFQDSQCEGKVFHRPGNIISNGQIPRSLGAQERAVSSTWIGSARGMVGGQGTECCKSHHNGPCLAEAGARRDAPAGRQDLEGRLATFWGGLHTGTPTDSAAHAEHLGLCPLMAHPSG